MMSNMSAKVPAALPCEFFDIFVLNIWKVIFGSDVSEDDIVGMSTSVIVMCFFGIVLSG